MTAGLNRLRFDEANRCLDQLKEEDARIDAEAGKVLGKLAPG